MTCLPSRTATVCPSVPSVRPILPSVRPMMHRGTQCNNLEPKTDSQCDGPDLGVGLTGPCLWHALPPRAGTWLSHGAEVTSGMNQKVNPKLRRKYTETPWKMNRKGIPKVNRTLPTRRSTHSVWQPRLPPGHSGCIMTPTADCHSGSS